MKFVAWNILGVVPKKFSLLRCQVADSTAVVDSLSPSSEGIAGPGIKYVPRPAIVPGPVIRI